MSTSVSRSALVALALLGSGCAAGALPPSRTDVGSTMIAGSGHMASGLRLTTGAHLASGTVNRDIPLDVGAGYVYERMGHPTTSGPAASQSLALTGAGSTGRSKPLDDHVDAHGAYLEVAHVIGRSQAHRSWLGARGEVLLRQSPEGRRPAAGAYARAAWELFAPRQGAGGFTSECGGGAGVAYGSLGLGLFVESGAQWTEDLGTAFVATAGLSVRLPFLAGFAFDLCPRC